MRILIATIAILLGLPAFALAAPARPPSPEDPPKSPPRPAFRPIQAPPPLRAQPRTAPRAATRRRTPAPRSAAPRAARPAAGRPVPAARPPALPTPRPVMPPPEAGPEERRNRVSTTLYRQRRRPGTPERIWHLRLSAVSHNLLVRHASLNPLKGDDLFSQGGLNGGVELWLQPRLVVAAEVGWAGGRFEDTAFDTDTTEVNAHSLRAGIRVGFRLWDSITPYVRGGFAATWMSARIRTDTQSLGGRAFAPGGYALGGVELTLRRSWMRKVFGSKVFTMGLVFEAGWVHLGQFKLDGGKSGASLVDDYRAGLGRLTLQGVTVNAGLVLAF